MEQTDNPLFIMEFTDGSRFELPTKWEDVFVDYFGEGESGHAQLAERIHSIVSKYIEHRAWSSKFDGITMEEVTDDSRYDDPEFYMESWDEWGAAGCAWGKRTIHHPTRSDIAEALLYQAMRGGLMQKALDEYAKEKGIRAPRVVNPKKFLKELEDDTSQKSKEE